MFCNFQFKSWFRFLYIYSRYSKGFRVARLAGIFVRSAYLSSFKMSTFDKHNQNIARIFQKIQKYWKLGNSERERQLTALQVEWSVLTRIATKWRLERCIPRIGPGPTNRTYHPRVATHPSLSRGFQPKLSSTVSFGLSPISIDFNVNFFSTHFGRRFLGRSALWSLHVQEEPEEKVPRGHWNGIGNERLRAHASGWKRQRLHETSPKVARVWSRGDERCSWLGSWHLVRSTSLQVPGWRRVRRAMTVWSGLILNSRLFFSVRFHGPSHREFYIFSRPWFRKREAYHYGKLVAV